MDIKELKKRARKKRKEKITFDDNYLRIAEKLYSILNDIFCYYKGAGELKNNETDVNGVPCHSIKIGDYELERKGELGWISYVVSHINSSTRITVLGTGITGIETFALDFYDYLLKYEYAA